MTDSTTKPVKTKTAVKKAASTPPTTLTLVSATGSEAELIELVRRDPWAFKRIPEDSWTLAVAVAACEANVHVWSSVPASLSLLTQAVSQLLTAATSGQVMVKPGSAVATYIEQRSEANDQSAEEAREELMGLAAAQVAYEVERRVEECRNLIRVLKPEETGKMDAEFEALLSRARAVSDTAAANTSSVGLQELRAALLDIAANLFKASLDKDAMAVRAVAQGLG